MDPSDSLPRRVKEGIDCMEDIQQVLFNHNAKLVLSSTRKEGKLVPCVAIISKDDSFTPILSTDKVDLIL